ncbi:FAD-dependent oxidoreductase [Lacipirellula limnantheis]|uniref:FAD dependent oxidoreductase n=1 Tax=Lacipirellula limnantheis TaxID=2528024 RepID=A0A517U149_9BACT|nr:FAD-dependent oxidoreductase [Lacipirellula limnantheis]QDT74357.1 FAD dependent oxidoreductase [Lacipirellula limnantheis]
MTRFLSTIALYLMLALTSGVIGANSAVVVAAEQSAAVTLNDYDVIIAGGSTAAFAAALASAESGARTALLEPTDWVGGQLTSSGVPAVDEAWHTIKATAPGTQSYSVARVARDPANITPSFHALMQYLENPADCWVSRFCFCPDSFVRQLEPLEKQLSDKLTIFRETVVKRVELNGDGDRIASLTAIQRKPKPGVRHGGYDRLPSKDLADWYSPQESDRFTKRVLYFGSRDGAKRSPVFIDATEWGEVLALADAPYLQGVEATDGGLAGDDRTGQATVFCFVEEFLENPADEPKYDVPLERMGFATYEGRADAWDQVWTYRRIRGDGPPAPGDLCLQNWGYSAKVGNGGNDYPFGYLFPSKADAAATCDDWQGGVDLAVMAGAEERALGWHEWFKRHAPDGIDPKQIVLNSTVLGTGHGLAKLPYIRDTRRSIGLDGYVLPMADLVGDVADRTGTKFDDRIALGAYPADIHPIVGREFPKYIHAFHDTLPFYIPFRALTNERIENMLVAGKTMAQSFMANSATRLHPTEWSTGTAAGVAAAYMAKTGKTARLALESVAEVQKLVKAKTPIDWTIPADAYTAK